MPISAPAVTLAAATATKVASGTVGSATVPVSVVLWNATTSTVYLGGSNVTASGATQGLPVAANSFSPSFDLVSGDDLWVISTPGGVVNTLLTRQ